MIRIAVFGLAMLLFVSIFAGCNDNDNDAPATSIPATSSVPVISMQA